MTYRTTFAAVAAGLVLAQIAAAADWITAPSYYSHDPDTGQRVTQYSPIGPFYTFASRDFQRSGYRHTRSTIQAGQSADNYHRVEEWGRPVRPYGEWRFPYRPYSVPYAGWGAPFAGLNQPGFFPNVPLATPFNGAPGGQPSGQPMPYSQQQPPPYYDGRYPQYRARPSVPWNSRQPSRPHSVGPGHGGSGPGGGHGGSGSGGGHGGSGSGGGHGGSGSGGGPHSGGGSA